MTIYTILAFSGAMFLLALTPGPGVFATISRAMASGFNNAAFVVAGIVLGDIVYLLFAIFGLSVIAIVLGDFFILIKYIGGLYLIYLGYKIITSKNEKVELKGIKELSWKKNFLTGLFVTLSNPKAILFYLSFLPTFVNLQTMTSIDILITALIVIFVLGSVTLSYAYAASYATTLFKSEKATKKMNIAAGSMMSVAGVFLIAKP